MNIHSGTPRFLTRMAVVPAAVVLSLVAACGGSDPAAASEARDLMTAGCTSEIAIGEEGCRCIIGKFESNHSQEDFIRFAEETDSEDPSPETEELLVQYATECATELADAG